MFSLILVGLGCTGTRFSNMKNVSFDISSSITQDVMSVVIFQFCSFSLGWIFHIFEKTLVELLVKSIILI